MALTPEQITQMNQITGMSKPVTPAQASSQSRAQQILALVKPEKKIDTKGAVPFGTPETNSGEKIADAFNSGAKQVYEGVNQALHPGQAAGNMPLGVLKAGAGVVNAVMSPIAPGMKPISDTVNAVADKVSDNKGVQDFAQSKAGEIVSKGAEGAANASTIAGAIAGGVKAPEVGTVLKNTAGDIKDALTPEPPPPGAAAAEKAQAEATQKATTATKIQRVADDWAKPAVPGKSTNPASFNKAADILSQSPGISKFLAEQKLSPAQHIENGRFATADSATALRDTAGKMSNDALRPSLQQADYNTPKTSVTDVVKNAITEAKKDPNITPGNLETVIRNINKEGSALQRKFPDGMSLENMHDYKITYAKNGGYKPNGTVADNNIATMNRGIGSSLQKIVEDKAPADVPVKDFNEYLSQYYKAADYLDAIDTKKSPMSIGQYVAHKGAQVMGATIGNGIGGGILGGVGGYMIGGALEHAIENMALPLRDSFLKNLKITKPDVYQKVADYVGNEEAARATRLALPEGSIQLGSGADKSGVTSVPAEKTLPTANPKTGRMQKTYLSSNQPITQEAATASTNAISVHDIARSIKNQMPNLQYSRIYDIAERAEELSPDKQGTFIASELSKINKSSLPK